MKTKLTPTYKKIYIVSNGFNDQFKDIMKFESINDPENLILGDGKTPLDEVLKDPRYLSIKGNVMPNTTITILAHGATIDEKHIIATDMDIRKTIGSEEFISSVITDLGAKDTALNFNLISCHAGAATLPKNAAKGSVLIKHSEPEDIVIANSGQLKLSADIQDIFNNIMDYSTQTFTIKIKDRAELVMRPPRKILLTAEEIIKYYEGERNRLISEYNKGLDENERIDPSKLEPLTQNSEKKEGHRIPTLKAIKSAQAWRERNLRYYLLSYSQSSSNLAENTFYGRKSANLNADMFKDLVDKLEKLGYREKPLIKKIINKNIDGYNLITYSLNAPNSTALVKTIVELGADLNARNTDGTTAAHACGICGDIETIKYLKSKGLNLNVKDNKGQSPIFYCKEVASLEYFLENGMDINSKNAEGKSVIRNIIEVENQNLPKSKRIELVKYLIKKGAKIDQEIDSIIISYAKAELEYEKTSDTKNLESKVAKDNEGQRTIFDCIEVSELKYFLDNGVNINSKNAERKSVMRNIIEVENNNLPKSKRIELVKYLIKKGAKIDQEIANTEIIRESKAKSWIALPKLGKSFIKKMTKEAKKNPVIPIIKATNTRLRKFFLDK